jgi:hypothetical protein
MAEQDVLDAIAALAVKVDAVLSAVAPTSGMTITEATLDSDGVALGRTPPYAEITAYLNDVACYRWYADADGDFNYVLPVGSVWTLIATAPQYETSTATVSTDPAIS